MVITTLKDRPYQKKIANGSKAPLTLHFTPNVFLKQFSFGRALRRFLKLVFSLARNSNLKLLFLKGSPERTLVLRTCCLTSARLP